ncbi:MAG: molybdopterin-binding protein [Chloroflexi bacterium]|nr:molybdopterin-binding protein [Chloroflexota bacterium]
MPEFLKLLPADEAWEIFTQHFTPVVVPELCRVADALDRVLARDATAPHELPTFVRGTVDGYAVQAADTHGATPGMPAYLDVVAEAAMGQQTDFILGPGQAALAHTGGMVPQGADAVVMIEHTNRAGPPMFAVTKDEGRKTKTSPAAFEAYSIEVMRAVAAGDNCIQPGEDVTAGELILSAGHTLRPQDLGGLLAVGITEVQTARQPRVGIVSQGDEVVPPEQEPGPGQVRDVNSYTLAGYVRRAGGIPLTYPIAPDTQEEIDAAVRAAFDEADVVVVTAGSSVSYRDLTAHAINALGRPGVLVHGVAIRPGKPTILAVCEGKPVFGLPGNPVSCINIFGRFVTPTLRLLLGAPPLKTQTVAAKLARNIPAASGRADYVRVRLEERDGETWAVPVFGKSNLIYTLIRSDGVVEVSLNSNGIAAETMVRVVLD